MSKSNIERLETKRVSTSLLWRLRLNSQLHKAFSKLKILSWSQSPIGPKVSYFLLIFLALNFMTDAIDLNIPDNNST